MLARVLSVNIGTPAPRPANRPGNTGIGKRPVDRAMLRSPGPRRGGLGSGLEGDFIGNSKHHGGDRQAVYAFAREELDAWAERLDRPLPNGMFGENLTTWGLAVDDALIGERWQIGDAVVLEVCGPRTPCATFRGWMGERGWLRRFSEVGRTGAYLSIEQGGEVRPGDPIEVIFRPEHGITTSVTFSAWRGDPEALQRVLDADCLPADETRWLTRARARSSPAPRPR